MTDKKITILLADDQAILRQGLRRILEAEADLAVVGEAATGPEAVKRARQQRPNVAIMEISLPEQDGVESMRQILQSTQRTKVLILSARMEHHFISDAVAAGASGYLSKDSFDHELISAVRTIVNGGTVFSPKVSRILAESSQNASPSARSLDALTAREREIFFLLAEGKSPSEVASSLFVSPKTVHTHRQHIMEKLGLQNTTALIRFALRQGLIQNV